jgi:hypothetical protein
MCFFSNLAHTSNVRDGTRAKSWESTWLDDMNNLIYF